MFLRETYEHENAIFGVNIFNNAIIKNQSFNLLITII